MRGHEAERAGRAMNAFIPAGRTIHRVAVPRQGVRPVDRSTGSRDPNTARKIELMVGELGPKELRAWDILEAVTSRRVKLATLWDWWVADRRDLAKIRARLGDVDLALSIPAWRRAVLLGAGEDTAAHYEHAVRTLCADATLFRSSLTTARIREWLGTRTKVVGQGKEQKHEAVATGTARKYHAALSSFLDYCRSITLLDRDLMADVPTPAKGAPRDRHLETAEIIDLADAMPEPFRTITALMAGTGIEVSVALDLRVADVDTEHQEIRARGTKTRAVGPWRDRMCRVATWAWPYVKAAIAGKRRTARLFKTPNLDRWAVADATAAACAKLEIRDYTPRDHRHSWAVRSVKSGMPIALVARQLGHKDGVLALQVYGRHEPRQEERAKWELIAAAQDAAALGATQAKAEPYSGSGNGSE
jgi:integrase